MTRTVHIETELPTDADRVWSAMQHPASFLYVTSGLFRLPALAGRTDPIRAGESVTGRLYVFHVLPTYRHSIQVVDLDNGARTIRTHEHGGILRSWHHILHVAPLDESRCRYSDTVSIDAGRLTPLVATLAVCFYRYRQRRWNRLVHKHLRPGGPRYARLAG